MKRNYTEQAEKAISKASRYAAKMGRSVIGTEHLLYGLRQYPVWRAVF